MKIDELIAALQPLVGWHVCVISCKRDDVIPCYAVRELEEHEQRHGRDVVLATSADTDGAHADFPPGIILLAENIVRVDWVGGRAWVEHKDHQLGYFQRVRPISERRAQDVT